MQIIIYILLAITLTYSIYYVITGIFGFKNYNKQFIKNHHAKYKFGVLIPCRNEENVIGNLIDSLNKQNYPKELYEIIVLPNNCNDKTEEIVLSKKANILKFRKKVTCKGDVLKLAFNKLIKRNDIDAFIIFDADNVVHPNFLKNMNNALCEGYNVAQGCRDSKNPYDNWISGSYSIFYWVQNFFFNKARMQINGSASINGTGFMVKKDVIIKNGFDVHTLTEDVEFSALCAINNEKIAYVENAITYDEQPVKMKASWHQRKRWTAGTYQCLKRYHKKLLSGFIKNKNIACLDMFLNFLAPVIQLLGMLFLLLAVVNDLIAINTNKALIMFLSLNIVGAVVLYCVNLLIDIFVVKYNKKSVKLNFDGLILFALFMLTWIPINITCLFNKDLKWKEIKHERSINVNQLIK